jgi:hypothetical protein
MTQTIQKHTPAIGATGEQDELLARSLQRHREFWERTGTQPLLRVAPWRDWQPYPPFVARDGSLIADGTEILPGLLDPVATAQATRPSVLLDGDMIGGWGAYDQCWTEAILGCRVVRGGPSVWAQESLTGWEQVDSISPGGSAAWLEEFLAANQVIVAETRGQYPVSQPLMRGPLDMIAAAMPSEVVYPGFYEYPGQMQKLLALCCALFVNVAQARLAATPRFHGGYAVRYEWGLWAPGTTVQFQADASRNLSPQTYRRFLFDIDRTIASQFEYSIIHTHSGSRHILPVLVQEPELGAIEVTLDPDPYGPPARDLLPSFHGIQEAGKALFISGPMTRADLDMLLKVLAPAGLAIRAGILPE